MEINQWAEKVHKLAREQGWWENAPKIPSELKAEARLAKHMLFVTEVAEASEEVRNKMPPVVQIGFTVNVGGKGWGCTKFYAGGWATEPSKDANWTYDSRIKDIGEVAWQIVTLLKKAKKDRLQQMVGVPIKAYFEPQGSTRLAGMLHHIEIFEDVI